MKNKYSLSTKDACKLISTIFIALIFKVITVKDIHYNDGIITGIDGISFDHKEVIVERDIYKIENEYRKCILVDKTLMSENWEKYIINLQKLIK